MGTEMGRGWDLGDGGLMVPVEPQPHALSNTYLQTIPRSHHQIWNLMEGR